MLSPDHPKSCPNNTFDYMILRTIARFFSVETTKGIQCWMEKRPIEKIGLYIPGGTAPLFSTVLMLAVPAQIAGCAEIVLCSPPNKKGKIAKGSFGKVRPANKKKDTKKK